MKLWVLKSDVCAAPVYVTPGNKYTDNKQLALKFESEDSALEYKKENDHTIILHVEPYFTEVDFNEK